jgi:hypothetical protein
MKLTPELGNGVEFMPVEVMDGCDFFRISIDFTDV